MNSLFKNIYKHVGDSLIIMIGIPFNCMVS